MWHFLGYSYFSDDLQHFTSSLAFPFLFFSLFKLFISIQCYALLFKYKFFSLTQHTNSHPQKTYVFSSVN